MVSQRIEPAPKAGIVDIDRSVARKRKRQEMVPVRSMHGRFTVSMREEHRYYLSPLSLLGEEHRNQEGKKKNLICCTTTTYTHS